MSQVSPAERGAKVRVPPPLVFLASIGLGVAVQALVVAAHFPVSRWLTIVVGTLIAAGGFAFGLSARNLFVRSGQDPAPWKPSPELVLAGPYRFTRNPMYVGLTLLEVGLGIALNNVWMALLAAPALLIVHLTAVIAEETYLREKFGASYVAFQGRVRRYL